MAESNTKQFIYNLVDAFSSKDYKSYRNPNYKNENIERKIAEKYDLDWMEPTGFNEKLYDNLEPDNDQTHHFVAFVEFGYKFGTIGFIGSRAWEILNKKGKANPGDVRLGDLGVVAGMDVRYAYEFERFGAEEKGFWKEPGNWIRTYLGGDWDDFRIVPGLRGFEIKWGYFYILTHFFLEVS